MPCFHWHPVFPEKGELNFTIAAHRMRSIDDRRDIEIFFMSPARPISTNLTLRWLKCEATEKLLLFIAAASERMISVFCRCRHFTQVFQQDFPELCKHEFGQVIPKLTPLIEVQLATSFSKYCLFHFYSLNTTAIGLRTMNYGPCSWKHFLWQFLPAA